MWEILKKKTVWPILLFGITLLGVVFFGPLRPYIVPPIKKIINIRLELLADFMLYIFLTCCIILAFLLYLLDREKRKEDHSLPKYRSAYVAKDYYKGIKKVDYYRAIKHILSRYRVDFDEQYVTEGKKTTERRRSIRGRRREPTVKTKSDEKGWGSKVAGKADVSLDAPDTVVEENLEGIVRTYYKNGQIEQEANYSDGKLEGLFRRYYHDGNLNQEKHFKDGQLNGLFRAYDEYGIPFFEMHFKDGVKHGTETTYYKNGVVQYKDIYHEGQKINRKTYNESGELTFDHYYIDEEELEQKQHIGGEDG